MSNYIKQILKYFNTHLLHFYKIKSRESTNISTGKFTVSNKDVHVTCSPTIKKSKYKNKTIYHNTTIKNVIYIKKVPKF